MSLSTPIKNGVVQSTNQTASQAMRELANFEAISNVPGPQFGETYLSGTGGTNDQTWTVEDQKLIGEITGTPEGKELSLYTDQAPLLRLLNGLSKRVFDSLDTSNTQGLVFRSCKYKYIFHPFHGPRLSPDIVALWEPLEVLSPLADPDDHPDFACTSAPTWSNLAAVGEVKATRNAETRIGNYVWNFLQLHPQSNAVLGFSVQAKGYRLLYHDASVILQSSRFEWELGPLFTFIKKLYMKPFRDPSMAVLDLENVKIGEDVFVSDDARPEKGLGQRRFTAMVVHTTTRNWWFLKEYWRDMRRRFVKGPLYEKAHKEKYIPGLMSADYHGYVLDVDQKRVQTTALGPGTIREKMRITTRDVGQSLKSITSLRQFLCVMYDACVVQRNLYRKSKILHRDISDSNIMIAPTTDVFYERCAGGYDEVKYINQVLVKDRQTKPRPACLVIDLGNGADLEAAQGAEQALTERTGTPKFIARSVSRGKLITSLAYTSYRVRMPKLEGKALEMYEFMDQPRRKNLNEVLEAPSSSDPYSKSVEFRHRLFHDAESVFWVVAWTLARSAQPAYQPETTWNSEFRFFINTMRNHRPLGDSADGRSEFEQSIAAWTNILHPDLACMVSMLSAMHEYIFPEWAYRDQLDPEHVHEALMRLLLKEIVRSDEHDIPLAIGVRALPVESTHRW